MPNSSWATTTRAHGHGHGHKQSWFSPVQEMRLISMQSEMTRENSGKEKEVGREMTGRAQNSIGQSNH